jgi:hypothetical protein
MMRKCKMDAVWPIIIKGGSTGCRPIHVRLRRSAASAQNKHWLIGRNIRLRCLDVCRRRKAAKIRRDRTRATRHSSSPLFAFRLFFRQDLMLFAWVGLESQFSYLCLCVSGVTLPCLTCLLRWGLTDFLPGLALN